MRHPSTKYQLTKSERNHGHRKIMGKHHCNHADKNYVDMCKKTVFSRPQKSTQKLLIRKNVKKHF